MKQARMKQARMKQARMKQARMKWARMKWASARERAELTDSTAADQNLSDDEPNCGKGDAESGMKCIDIHR